MIAPLGFRITFLVFQLGGVPEIENGFWNLDRFERSQNEKGQLNVQSEKNGSHESRYSRKHSFIGACFGTFPVQIVNMHKLKISQLKRLH